MTKWWKEVLEENFEIKLNQFKESSEMKNINKNCQEEPRLWFLIKVISEKYDFLNIVST